jgi:hypothetical protein
LSNEKNETNKQAPGPTEPHLEQNLTHPAESCFL